MVHLENALGPLGHAPERIPCLEALREPLKGTLLRNSHRGNPLVVVGLGLLFWGVHSQDLFPGKDAPRFASERSQCEQYNG